MRRFFIESHNLKEKTGIIDGSDFNHIKNVLRLKNGDSVILFDGKSGEYIARIEKFKTKEILLHIIEKKISKKESPIEISVAQAYLKGNKIDNIIRQLSELGIKKWSTFFSERTIPKIDAKKIEKKIERWEKIAKESLKQCERNAILQIEKPKTFNNLLALAKENDLNIIFWEGENIKNNLLNETNKINETNKTNKINKINKILIIIGPEGGFSQKEIKLAKQNQFLTISLGPRILKADTATIASCAIIQHIFGDM